MAVNSGGDSGVVLTDTHERHKAKGLFDAIDEIQQYSAAESMMIDDETDISKFFTISMKFEYFTVGFKHTLGSMIISMIFHPFFFAVLNGTLPIFGDTTPTLFDKIYISILSLGYIFGYAFFFWWITSFNTGKLTDTMILNLLGGITAGSVFKALIGFVALNLIYFHVWTPEGTWGLLSKLDWYFTYESLVQIYNFLMALRESLPNAALLMLIAGVFYIVVSWTGYWVFRLKRKKMRKIS